MKSNWKRNAVAAALAALSLPALASDTSPSSIAGDPTWPAVAQPAPAVSLAGEAGGVADLTAADYEGVAPAVALAADAKAGSAPQIQGEPSVARVAAVLGTVQPHVAER